MGPGNDAANLVMGQTNEAAPLRTASVRSDPRKCLRTASVSQDQRKYLCLMSSATGEWTCPGQSTALITTSKFSGKRKEKKHDSGRGTVTLDVYSSGRYLVWGRRCLKAYGNGVACAPCPSGPDCVCLFCRVAWRPNNHNLAHFTPDKPIEAWWQKKP